MPEVEGLDVGDIIIEGKTKIVYKIPSNKTLCLILSKDKITAGDGAKKHDMIGKAAISTATTCQIFEYLQQAGIKTHFVKMQSETSFLAKSCTMIPIEWVTRRIATGSFLRRNPGVEEGYKFCPLKQEIFYKDDENHDPQWSFEQLISAKWKIGSNQRIITEKDVKCMSEMTKAIFEIIEKAWASRNCQLIDMKIEFGVDSNGEIILADVIDSDSWRLWPHGDKRMMKDKQLYRDSKNVTNELIEQVKINFNWVADQLQYFNKPNNCRIAIFMGSVADMEYCRKIEKACNNYSMKCDLRICSAHKVPSESLDILAYYESLNIPVVIIAVAGRSNALGPLLSANSSIPVINCPPLGADWVTQDIWSSLHVPSGLGCVSVLSPDNAAQSAAQIIAMNNHHVWARLRSLRMEKYTGLLKSDEEINKLIYM